MYETVSGGSGAGPLLILGEKEEMTEGRNPGWASKIEPPLAQGMDPPLTVAIGEKGECFWLCGKMHMSTFLHAV